MRARFIAICTYIRLAPQVHSAMQHDQINKYTCIVFLDLMSIKHKSEKSINNNVRYIIIL
jgi:hypothetical protein